MASRYTVHVSTLDVIRLDERWQLVPSRGDGFELSTTTLFEIYPDNPEMNAIDGMEKEVWNPSQFNLSFHGVGLKVCAARGVALEYTVGTPWEGC